MSLYQRGTKEGSINLEGNKFKTDKMNFPLVQWLTGILKSLLQDTVSEINISVNKENSYIRLDRKFMWDINPHDSGHKPATK